MHLTDDPTQVAYRAVLERELSARGFDMDQLQELEQRTKEGPSLLVAVGAFDLQDYVEGLIRFLPTVPLDDMAAWYANFTKAIYLVGLPRRFLKHRGTGAARSPSEAVAFIGPALPSHHQSTVQLLRPLRTAACPPMSDIVVDTLHLGNGDGTLELRINTSRMTSLEAYLISVGHSIAESYHLGHLAKASSLRLRHQDALDELAEDRLFARVHVDPLRPGHLAQLTSLHRLT